MRQIDEWLLSGAKWYYSANNFIIKDDKKDNENKSFEQEYG